MDEFLLNTSFILGVSQVSLENDFYMVDLPELIQLKFKKEQAEKLTQLQILIASNNRSIEEKDYKLFINSMIPKDVKKVEDNLTFDRNKFEQLRSRH